jgi:hypothetical protein
VIILFGTRTYLYQLAVLTLVCGRCGNPSGHMLRKRVLKFTLFFVPLFPISTKYSTQCASCGAEQQVPKEQADGMLATIAQGGGAPAPGRQLGQAGRPAQPGHAGPGGGQQQGYGQPGAYGGSGPYGQQDGGAAQQSNPYQR